MPRVRVSAVIVRDRKILLCKFDNLNFWMLPGGAVEEGESLGQALSRELSEELNIQPLSAEFMGVFENIRSCNKTTSSEICICYKTEMPSLDENFIGAEPGLLFRYWDISQINKINLQPSCLIPLLQMEVNKFDFFCIQRNSIALK